MPDSGSAFGNLVLTPEEKKVFSQLFATADTQNLGVITGELAVKFFEKSGLKPQVLGEIWGIADTENRGLLTKSGFSVALRLIGRAQSGEAPRAELGQIPGPIPTFKGVNLPWGTPSSPQSTSQTPQPPTSPLQQQLTGSGIAVPRLSSEDVTRFSDLYDKSGAVDGLLPGESARQIFQRAKLPNSTLGVVWSLADRQQRGALGQTEFVVAMHLIQCTMNGSMPVLPNSLPQALFDAASRVARPPTGDGRQRPPPPGPGPRPMPSGIPSVPQIPRQFNPARAQSPLRREFTPPVGQQGPIAPSNPAEIPWEVSPQDKAKFDTHFTEVDLGNKGFITGEEAVPFFSGSKLPEEALAQIWDLADMHKNGNLTREEFAVAMHLIRLERTKGTNGRGLPETLPIALVPPHMRAQLGYTAPQQPKEATSSPFDTMPDQPKSTLDDLFGLDESFTSASPTPTSTIASKGLPTAGLGLTSMQASNDTFGGVAGRPPMSAPPTTVGPSSFYGSSTKQFIPSSSFGQSIITPSVTGGTASSKDTPSHLDDLLDPEVSKKLTSEQTELANLSNQIGSLTKQTQDLKIKRASTDQNIVNVANEKHGIELKLAQLRQSYENEEKELRRVEELLATSRADTARLRNDYAIIEASLVDLRNQKAQTTTAYEGDVRENQALKEKMKTTNQETGELRKELEKLKLDARQQKGLVAINKKQLATSENEKEKVKGEIEQEKKDLSASQELTRGISPQPPASPTLSQTSTVSTNPFSNPFHRKSPQPGPESTSMEKRLGESVASPSSPFASGATAAPAHSFYESVPQSNIASPSSNAGQNAFDNVFGSFAAPAGNGPPPPTTFTKQNTGNKEVLPSTTFSAPSMTESAFGGSTPPTSPPTSSYSSHTTEIPPSVGSSQITSAFLPLPLNRTESTTSSVQVQPPSESAFSRPETPTTWGESSAEGRLETESRDIFRPSPLSHSSTLEHTEAPKPLERTVSESTTGISRVKPERQDTASDFGNSDTPLSSAMPGGFPGMDVETPMKPTATGESYMSTMSNKSRTSQTKPPSDAGAPRQDAFNFGRDEHRGPQSSRDDFDSAFAGFSSNKPERAPTMTTGSKEPEFPPIRELHDDEDSDSASDNGGFEDSFTPASPKAAQSSLSAVIRDSFPSSSGPPDANAGRLNANMTQPPGPGTPLPGPNAQMSPPAYTSSNNGPIGSSSDMHSFPPEFTNLLPSRSDPTKSNTNLPPVVRSGTAEMFMASPAMTPPATSHVDNVFGPSNITATSVQQPTSLQTSNYDAYTSTQPKGSTQPAVQPKSAFDDNDDDFESSFKDLVDAREAESKGDTYDEFASHEGFDEFNPVFDSPGPAKHAPTAPLSSKAPNNEDDFEPFQFNTGSTAPGTAAPPKQSNEDWDALFASLEGNRGEHPGQAVHDRGTTISHANGSRPETDAFGVATSTPGNVGNLTTQGKDGAKLQELQSMGFSEDQANKALQKFDFNLTEATNFLLDHPTSPAPR